MFNSIKGRSFSNVLFSNLTKDKNNNINFDLKFNVSPELLSYEKSILLDLGSANSSIELSNPLSNSQIQQ